MSLFSAKNPFTAARNKGGDFLLAKLRPDGGFGSGLKDCYKTLTALQVCGYSDAASRLCGWIRSHMTDDGDFSGRPKSIEQHNYLYANSWIIIGAHRLGQFDLSMKGMEFLESHWDPKTGGFYSSPIQRDADTKQDLIYTGFGGLAALYTGRVDIARGVGHWMKTVMEAQPDFPEKLYTVYSRTTGLITVPDPNAKLRYVVSRDAEGDQFFFQPGVAGAFLARLFQATGEKEWLDLAQEYMRFVEGANDHLFRLVRAGKVAWAAAILFMITRQTKYKEIAARIGHNLTASQSRRGYWTGVGSDTPDDEITAEMVIWLDEIDQGGCHP